MLQQRAFQHPPTLHKQASIDGFVGDLHARIVGVSDLEPPRNLLRGPIDGQFRRDRLLQRRPLRQPTRLGPSRIAPGAGIGPRGPIGRLAAMTAHFSANRGPRPRVRWRPMAANDQPAATSARQLFALAAREHPGRPVSRRRASSARSAQHFADRWMCARKGLRHPPQRLALLPPLPQLRLLCLRPPVTRHERILPSLRPPVEYAEAPRNLGIPLNDGTSRNRGTPHRKLRNHLPCKLM